MRLKKSGEFKIHRVSIEEYRAFWRQGRLKKLFPDVSMPKSYYDPERDD